MVKKFTEDDFLSLFDWRKIIKDSDCKCKRLTTVAKYSGVIGHENCDYGCPGNYFHGGTCNYGGEHKIEDELKILNGNFSSLEVVVNDHKSLKKIALDVNTTKEKFEKERERVIGNLERTKENCEYIDKFAFNCCIGVNSENNKLIWMEEAQKRFKKAVSSIQYYIDQVKDITLEESLEFQAKLKQVENLQENNKKLRVEYKDATPERRIKIMALIDENNKEISKLGDELNEHVARPLFDPNTEIILTNLSNFIIKGISKVDIGQLGNKEGGIDWSANLNKKKLPDKDNKDKKIETTWSIEKILIVGGIGIGGLILVIIILYMLKQFFKR